MVQLYLYLYEIHSLDNEELELEITPQSMDYRIDVNSHENIHFIIMYLSEIMNNQVCYHYFERNLLFKTFIHQKAKLQRESKRDLPTGDSLSRCLQWLWLGQVNVMNFFQISHVGGGGSSTWALLHLFTQAISKDLGVKQNRALSWCPFGVATLHAVSRHQP